VAGRGGGEVGGRAGAGAVEAAEGEACARAFGSRYARGLPAAAGRSDVAQRSRASPGRTTSDTSPTPARSRPRC
jgi:hypothetical protein